MILLLLLNQNNSLLSLQEQTMEAVGTPPLNNSSVEAMKVTAVVEEDKSNIAVSVKDTCHKSNGISESSNLVSPAANEPIDPLEESLECSGPNTGPLRTELNVEQLASTSVPDANTTLEPVEKVSNEIESVAKVPATGVDSEGQAGQQNQQESNVEYEALEESVVDIDNTLVPPTDTERVTFETEILIETNDSDVIEQENTEIKGQSNGAMLSELGQSIELSEALRSSDVADNVQNNNGAGQEVFNKEELLDILEGNDGHQTENILEKSFQDIPHEKLLETQVALQQLSRLKESKRKYRKSKQIEKSPKIVKNDSKVRSIAKQEVVIATEDKIAKNDSKVRSIAKQEVVVATEDKAEENIVNDLVKEWDDEDATEGEKTIKLGQESNKLVESCVETVKMEEPVAQQGDTSLRTSIDSADGKHVDMNKSSDDGQPQRRLGRVIKKKVIFDPDNPDTFTKSKANAKVKDTSSDREQTPSKKTKPDHQFQRSKSKSPLSKLQWKKPISKTPPNKQNKRLTEVDKLLMDEGAVNMIYQLTPEAPKGKKNMKTKAEFIKKIQSSTPDTKEMKFRERKKESKYEEGDAKKILGGKQRSSLNSSVKSPSVCEDFEAHSADDSIIYRRHSSSSYSSSCMSPRRLSDVEANSVQVARQVEQVADNDHQPDTQLNADHTADTFMSQKLGAETINKNDCLSIKEKLNTKLNLALNKRKREHSKVEKPCKLKKVSKATENSLDTIKGLEYLQVTCEFQKLAQIRLQRPNIKCSVQVVRELQKALAFIESLKNVSVTLLTSECIAVCSDLNISPLLDSDVEKRTNNVHEMAESIRSTLQAVTCHSKLLCAAVSGNCTGLGLATISLSDMVLASELTTFSTTRMPYVPSSLIEPGLSVLTSLKIIPSNILNDMILFGRPLSASEALQGGLVSRIIWPSKFDEQVQDIARDISAQPAQNIWLKKQLLNLKKRDSESTFLSCLEKERDLFIEYWTSAEGQEILRTANDCEKS